MRSQSIIPLFLLLQLQYFVWAKDCPILQSPCKCVSANLESASIECENGDSLEDVHKSLASVLSSIDTLTISYTPIPELPAFAFKSLTIKRLILQNNGLSRIDSNAFSGPLLNSLEELAITGNQLTSLPLTGINELRVLQTLSLSDNLITLIDNNAFLSYHSRTHLKKVDLSANNISVVYPQAFLGLESILQLSLDRNAIRWIPEEALGELSTLEELYLGVNEIENVSVGALRLPNLKSLSLELNKIRYIPSDALQTLPNLVHFYLGRNQFSQIESTMFFYVNQLKVLSLTGNAELKVIQANAFIYTPNLIGLDVSECSINTIEPHAFQKIPNVQVINLARNELTSVSQDYFKNLKALQSINLSGNKISAIDDYTFSVLPSLQIIDLSSNRLEKLPSNVFHQSLLQVEGRKRTVYLYNNPWQCDKDLVWLRKWLHANPDVEITRGAGGIAKCWTPSTVSGEDLRDITKLPSEPISALPDTTDLVFGEKLRKIIKVPPVTATSIVDFPPMVLGTEDAKVSSTNLAFLILAIVFGLLAICVILLVVIRCIMKAKEEKSKEGAYGADSVTSSAFAGSAYSTTGIYPDQHHLGLPNPHACATQGYGMQPHGAYLNRPRYWWF